MKVYDRSSLAQMPFTEIKATFVAVRADPTDLEAKDKSEQLYGYYREVLRGAVARGLYDAPASPLYEDKPTEHLFRDVSAYLLYDTEKFPFGLKGDAFEIIWYAKAYQLGYVDFGYDSEDFTFGLVTPYENIDLLANNAY